MDSPRISKIVKLPGIVSTRMLKNWVAGIAVARQHKQGKSVSCTNVYDSIQPVEKRGTKAR